MSATRAWKVVLGLAFAAALAATAWTGEKKEEEITLDQVPEAVKATILREAAGAKIEAIERVTEDGKTTYEVELSADGKGIELRIDADGKLIGKKVEEAEEELTLERVPPAVKATILKEAEGTKAEEITRDKQDDKTVYTAVLTAEGKTVCLEVDAAGKLISKEVEEELTIDQAPAAVKATILKEGEGAKVEAIVRVTQDAKTEYQVSLSAEGKEIQLTVDPEGKLTSKEAQEELKIDQVPAAVKAAILNEAKGGKVEQILRSTENDKTTYEVQLAVGGKTVVLELGADGKLISKEVEEEEKDERK